MSQIISFEDYTPPVRFDAVPWSEVRVEESDTVTLSSATVWTQIDAIALSPLDVDPEVPAARNFTTDQASDAFDLWYRVIFADASSNTTLPSVPVQNLEFPVSSYATVDELFRVIKVRDPISDEKVRAAQGDLNTATLEINAEMDLSADHAALTEEQLELVKGVCIDRAADLWRHRESAAGVLGIVDEGVPTTPGRYSWARYAARLSVLKDQWGIA